MPTANTDQPVTLGQFAAIMTGAPVTRLEAWHPYLVTNFSHSAIVTDVRQAAILASMANETGGMKLLDEADLSYISTPWSRIAEVFRGVRGLTRELVDSWRALGDPQFTINFLNLVYDDANRAPGYRLANTHPGDGFRYRGMGPGATTGLGNYRWMAQETGLPLVEDPELVKMPEAGARIVCHFWDKNGCNEMVDDGSQQGFLRAMTKLNAGLHDFSHHLAYWEVAKRALANDEIVDMPTPLPLETKRKSVRDLQEKLVKLGFDTGGVDGIVGPKTKAAILAFQKVHALTVDGIVGPRTWASIELELSHA